MPQNGAMLISKKWGALLNTDERNQLLKVTGKGRPSTRRAKRANIPPFSDSAKTDAEIVESLCTSPRCQNDSICHVVVPSPCLWYTSQGRKRVPTEADTLPLIRNKLYLPRINGALEPGFDNTWQPGVFEEI